MKDGKPKYYVGGGERDVVDLRHVIRIGVQCVRDLIRLRLCRPEEGIVAHMARGTARDAARGREISEMMSRHTAELESLQSMANESEESRALLQSEMEDWHDQELQRARDDARDAARGTVRTASRASGMHFRFICHTDEEHKLVKEELDRKSEADDEGKILKLLGEIVSLGEKGRKIPPVK